MKKLYLLTLFALFSGVITFGQVWVATAPGTWSDVNNWSTGALPADDGTVEFGASSSELCTVDADAGFGRFKLAKGGPASMIIKSGVTLKSMKKVDWHCIGENAAATLTIEANATLDLGDHHDYIGRSGGSAVVDLYGTLTSTSSLGIDKGSVGAVCKVTIYTGGQLVARYIDSQGMGKDAIVDIRGGTLMFNGNEQADVTKFIGEGKIVAYGGGGTVVLEYIDSKTIVTSLEDLSAPTIESSSPADTETGVPGELPIIINFSKWMDRASVEAALTVTPAIPNQTLTWAQNTLTISGDPMTDLTVYTVSIGATATDVNGIAVASALSFSFTTIDPNAPPIVVTTSPLDAATGINEGTPIQIIFSKAMDSTSVSTAITTVPALENALSTWSNNYKTLSIAHDNFGWNQVVSVTLAAGAKALVDETVLAADYTFGYTVRGMPTTTNIWNPAQDGSSDGLWMTAANWTQGVVPDDPSYNYKVVLNVPGAGSVTLTDTVNVNCLRLGENGPGDTLFIEDKAYLKTNDEWNGFGISDTSVVIIKAGGTLDLSSHAWIAYHAKAKSTIDVYGTMYIKGSTGLNWADDGGVGTLTIHEGGVLNMRSLNDFSAGGANLASINAGSVIDVNGGEWTINRHSGQKAVAKQYIEAGRITAYKGAGFVRVVEDSIFSDVDTTYITFITSTMTRNTDATLSALFSDVGGVFKPEFNPAVTTYDLIVPFGSFWATIGGTPADKYASVSEDVFVDLSLGSGQAVITGIAEDGATKAYTVNVTVAEVSTPNISALKENAYYIASQDIVRVENAASVKMVSVFDLTGKLRFNSDVNKSETFDIDASALKQGLYIIQLRNSDGSKKSFKFIK
ncbi:MAG: Ig-like domain-containing protein [Bacteroidales bacterium]|nr:Ig-like domain-containing protein [Bacteroidales bacterium]